MGHEDYLYGSFFMLIPDAIAAFEAYLRFEKRFSDHTVIAYHRDLEQFSLFVQKTYEEGDVRQIQPFFVRTWLAQLKDDNISPRSINRKLSTLKSFFKYLQRDGKVEVSPVSNLSGPKSGKKLPSWVPSGQLEVLADRGMFEDGLDGETAWLLIKVLYETGIRRSEIIQLLENQIDTHAASIRVLGKGKKERIIPVQPILLKHIKTYIHHKREHGLMGPHLLEREQSGTVSPGWVYQNVKKYLGMVTTQEKRGPHVLRHSFATQLMNAGADLNAVKELLGHASLAATQVYTHNSIEKLKKVHGQAHPKG
jgi:integrase/recombinase XerC